MSPEKVPTIPSFRSLTTKLRANPCILLVIPMLARRCTAQYCAVWYWTLRLNSSARKDSKYEIFVHKSSVAGSLCVPCELVYHVKYYAWWVKQYMFEHAYLINAFSNTYKDRKKKRLDINDSRSWLCKTSIDCIRAVESSLCNGDDKGAVDRW